MKKILSLFVLCLALSGAVFAKNADWTALANGFYIKDLKRYDDIVSYTYKIDDLNMLGAVLHQFEEFYPINITEVSYLEGEVVVNCKNMTKKNSYVKLIGFDNSTLYTHKSAEWSGDESDLIDNVCSSTF